MSIFSPLAISYCSICERLSLTGHCEAFVANSTVGLIVRAGVARRAYVLVTLIPTLTCFAILSQIACITITLVSIDEVDARSAIEARRTGAFVDVCQSDIRTSKAFMEQTRQSA